MVVANQTAVMDVKWRWLPQTLEMVVRVDDDETDPTDYVAILFDSDNDGKLVQDRSVGLTSHNRSNVIRDCNVWVDPYWAYHNCSVRPPFYWMYEVNWLDIIAMNLTGCHAIYEHEKSYSFDLSIPRQLIGVGPDSPVHISFVDGSNEEYLISKTDTLAADFNI